MSSSDSMREANSLPAGKTPRRWPGVIAEHHEVVHLQEIAARDADHRPRSSLAGQTPPVAIDLTLSPACGDELIYTTKAHCSCGVRVSTKGW